MRAIRHVPIVLVAIGTVACTALLGDFDVGPASGGPPGGGDGGDGSSAEGSAAAVVIMPGDVKVGVLRVQAFTASVPVTWSVDEGAMRGTIDASGKYFAPETPGVVHVTATSKADATQKATATVTVAPLGISILTGANGGEGNIDGIPLRAHFKQPGGIAHLFDNGGGNGDRYYIADSGNHTIRLYDTKVGKVTTIAGKSGLKGRSDGVGAAASFTNPGQVIAAHLAQKIYIVDSDGTCIRSLDPTTNNVRTVTGQCGVSGNSDGGGGVAASFQNIRSFDINGGKFFGELGDQLFVCDSGQRIRRVFLTGASAGTATTIISGTQGCDLATDLFSGGGTAKLVYYLDGALGLKRFKDAAPFTVDLTQAAPETFTSGLGVASGQGPDGLFMLSSNRSVIYRAPLGSAFDTNPRVGAFDDDRVIDGPLATARVGRPTAIDVVTERGNGAILFADSYASAIRQVDLGANKLTTLIGAARMQDRVDGPRSSARLSGPFAITSDPSGTIYFADAAFDGPILNNTIRKVDMNGAVSSVAGKPIKPSITVAPLDGSKDDATFGFPIDIVALKGHLYVVDAFGQSVRKVSATMGNVSTLAGELGVSGGTADGIGAAAHFKFSDPMGGDGGFGGGIATDGTDLYICDSANFAIRKIAVATGQVTLLAGGTKGTANGIGGAAQFINPFGLAYDAGFLYIADAGDHTIRRLDLKTTEVTSLIGLSGQPGEKDGDAGSALFTSPARLQTDGLGNLFVAEIPFSSGDFNGLIRRVDIKGRKVSPWAGTLGQIGLAPGPLPSTLNCPLSFTITPQGDMAFADFCESTIALIKPL